MKRPLTFLFFLFLTFSLFAAGSYDLTVVSAMPDEENAAVLGAFHEKYPESTVEFLKPSITTGTTVTMDTRLLAGDETHVYVGFAGRVGKYATAKLALDFNDYITDQADFLDGSLMPYTVDGALLALPLWGNAFGMGVNLRMLEEIGYADFDFEDWTLAEFYMLADAVKAKYNGEKWATGLFFASQSGDYTWMNWLATFGAEMYHAGDYSQTVVGSKAGRDTFAFWLELRDEGYTRPDAAITPDIDVYRGFRLGEYLMQPFHPSWVKVYQEGADGQGIKDAFFPYKFVEFPRAPGVDKVPVVGTGSSVVAFQNHDKGKEAQSAYLAWLYTVGERQTKAIGTGDYPSRKSVTYKNESPIWDQMAKAVRDNGRFDLGLTQWFYADVRGQGFPIVQKMLNGELTADEANATYAAAVNAIVAK